MNESLKDKITRVRRQTRSADILDICDALEKALILPVQQYKDAPLLLDAISVSASYQDQFLAYRKALEQEMPSQQRFDKVAYQREYMRKRRAKAKGYKW